MSARRGAQLARTLRLLRSLDTGWLSIGELAEHFQVTRRTIRRDVTFLRGHDFEIQERPAKMSDRGEAEWRLVRWPRSYDLTQASAQTLDAVDPSGAVRGNAVRRA